MARPKNTWWQVDYKAVWKNGEIVGLNRGDIWQWQSVSFTLVNHRVSNSCCFPRSLYPHVKHLPIYRRIVDVFADLRNLAR